VRFKKNQISVVVPVYNCAQYIGQAVESIIRQTYRVSEILVVDDGSKDGTREALAQYVPSIKYFYQENRGEPSARNLGVRNALGEFIAFLDADDLWHPEKLELQMRCFEKHREYGFVYSDMQTFDETGIIEESVKVSRNLDLPSGHIFKRLFKETLFGSGSVIVKRECFDKVGLFNESLLVGSDYEMWLRICRHFEVGYVDKPLLLYRQHSNMATRTSGFAYSGTPWEVRALKAILELYPETVNELGRGAVNRRLSLAYFYPVYTHLERGDHLSARELLRHALRYWPTNPNYYFYYLVTMLKPQQASFIRNSYSKVTKFLKLSRQVVKG